MNNSATIAAVEHASAICSRLMEGVLHLTEKVLEKHPRLPRVASLWWYFKENL
jgi:hypothetical protein